MKIALISDLHLEFYYDTPSYIEYPSEDTDVVVLAGDIVTAKKARQHKEFFNRVKEYPAVVYVMGNHEHYGSSFKDTKTALEDATGIEILEKGTRSIQGKLFSGGTMWTPLSNYDDQVSVQQGMHDFTAIKDFNTNIWSSEYYSTLKVLRGSDVIVTHHLPNYLSIPERFKGHKLNAGFVAPKALEYVKQPWNYQEHEEMPGAKLWLHGHTHDAVDYIEHQCRVVAYPVGYPGELKASTITFKEIII
jgi:predicted phosphodiesterase